jgi:CubicO group peptidase (beta-lactamase class C family)
MALALALITLAGAAEAAPAFDPAGDWNLRWDRGFANWKPPMFEGRLHLERTGATWRAEVRFTQSTARFEPQQASLKGEEITASWKAGSDEVALRGWFRDGKLFGEMRWGTQIDWTPVAARRVQTHRLVDRARGGSSGLDGAALTTLLRKAAEEESSAVVVLRDGRVVVEAYREGYAGEPIMAMSASKSIVSLAVGMLVADGKLSLDRRLGELEPAWAKSPQAAITVRQLLNHTSGLDPIRATFANESIVKHAIGGKLAYPPGSRFQYNNNAVDLLAAVFARAAGIPLDRFLEDRLFSKLDVRGARWLKDQEGTPRGAGELSIRPLDLAKIGQLMLDGGKHDGAQLVPREWIASATAPGQNLDASCGLLWWREGDFDEVLHPSILEAWRELGLGDDALGHARRLLGRRFADRGAYRAALIEALGPGDWQRLGAIVDGGNHVPFAYAAERTPAVGYSARGWLGQYLVVLPNEHLVAVRMRPLDPSTDSEHGQERNGYPGFSRDVRALVPVRQ